MTTFVVALVIALLLAGTSNARAEIYRWTDERGNAHYADGLAGIPEKYRSSATPIGLHNSAPPPAADKAMATSRDAATIRFTPGERIIVNATINGREPVRLLLDTGADRTLISPKALEAAGVSMRDAPTGAIAGVTGQADVRGVTVDSLEVQQARATNMMIIAYEIDRAGVDGLLGRDFLDGFHVTIDSGAGTVTLRRK